jgi:hypothetical protein
MIRMAAMVDNFFIGVSLFFVQVLLPGSGEKGLSLAVYPFFTIKGIIYQHPEGAFNAKYLSEEPRSLRLPYAWTRVIFWLYQSLAA